MEIVYYPEEILKQPCEVVTSFDDNLKALVDEMTVLMYQSRGVGLAAPQAGLKLNVILVDPTAGNQSDQLTVMVNPHIIWASKETLRLSERCLSLPGLVVAVDRPEWIEMEYQDVSGIVHSQKLDGWHARIALHELDHLEGVMMVDRVKKSTKKILLECYTQPKKTQKKEDRRFSR